VELCVGQEIRVVRANFFWRAHDRRVGTALAEIFSRDPPSDEGHIFSDAL
jgi:hypothetical protein